MIPFVHATRRTALALAFGVSALVSACGGGDPVVPFEPTRVLAFGDENSVITAEGRKYTVNALSDANGVKTINCAANPLWVQQLASSFGLVFPECNPNAVVNPASRIYAQAGDKKVADLAAQVAQHLQTDTFSSRDLVTMLVGQNDLLELYDAYPTTATETLLETARLRGLALAVQVTLVADRGGKVLVSTVPELALTPFAAAEDLAAGDKSRSALLTALVGKFNEGLRVGIAKENGSEVAIMLTNELMQSMYKFPASFGGMSNVTAAACDEALAGTARESLDCTTDTLLTGATSTSHLWADKLHLSPNGHAYIGSLAASRARANPF